AAVDELHASLNLFEGPLIRVALFDRGAQKSSLLLIVIHHLVVDGVSWRILLEDLQTVYQQFSDGKPFQLPPKTTSFKQWAERISEHARSSSVQKEFDYWLVSCKRQFFYLPVDFSGGVNTEVSARRVSVSLSEEETRALLQEVPKAYHTEINDALLTALVHAFRAWTGEKSLFIELEGHGREEIFEEVNLSRTVGWFTSCFPVCLDIGNSSHPGEALKLVKEHLRRIPNRGIGFGLLCYLSENTAIAEQLRELSQPEVSFNYLGQFDQVLSVSSLFAWVRESAGPTRSGLGNRRELLSINGRVIRGQLQLDWNYSEKFHRRATIERLAQDFIDALRELISYCGSPQAGGFTPSDFPQADLNQ